MLEVHLQDLCCHSMTTSVLQYDEHAYIDTILERVICVSNTKKRYLIEKKTFFTGEKCNP